MHPQFLDVLCCPETGESLTLQALEVRDGGMVFTGTLHSESGRIYPIVRGVPRFVDEQQYAGSFGFEWSRWPRTQFEFENIGRPMEGHTTRMWERITGASFAEVAGKTLVEYGCGPGRFLDVVRTRGGRAVGIDLSDAVESARRNFERDPDVLIVQGDLLHPPFRPGSFDAGYSIGVLHHTPDPAAGLAALARIIAPEGWIACCVYPKGDFYDFPSLRRLRQLNAAIAPLCGYRFALAYAYVAAYVIAPLLQKAKDNGYWKLVQQIEKHWLVCLRLKDPHWRVLDVFDAITPAIATTHTTEQLKQWFEAAGCRQIEQTRWCQTSMRARRGEATLASAA